MGFRIEKRFAIDAPPNAVWAFLTDPYAVARCLPGAAITEQLDDRSYAGTMTVKVGPVSSSYKGKITFERLDLETKRAEITGRGQDVRGRGGADMRMTSSLDESDGGTTVTVTSDVNVTGILAQFGRGLIQDVSDQLFEQFTVRMRAELAKTREATPDLDMATEPVPGPAGEAEALDVVALGAGAGRRLVARQIRRPGFWAALAVVVLAVYLLFIR